LVPEGDSRMVVPKGVPPIRLPKRGSPMDDAQEGPEIWFLKGRNPTGAHNYGRH
jgi:hypothetical protein